MGVLRVLRLPAPVAAWPSSLAIRPGPSALVAALATAVFVLLGLPLVTVLVSSFKQGQTLPFDPAPLTLGNLGEVFGSPVTYRLLGTTFAYASGSILVGLGLAWTLAFLLERTDVPLRRGIFLSVVAKAGLPAMFVAFGWILLLSPRTGMLNLLLRDLRWPGEVGPLDIYGLSGMIFVTGFGVTPTIFFLLAPALGKMDASLEEAALASGAGRGQVLRRVTLPLLLPALLGAAIYLAVVMVQHFEVPLALGLPGNVTVLSTRIFMLARSDSGLPDYGLASAYGLLTLALGLVLIALYHRALVQESRFVVVTGKGYRAQQLQLGRWRWAAVAFMVLFVLLGLVLPLAALLWTSLLPAYRPPSPDALAQVGLRNYTRLFSDPFMLRAVQNTLVVAVASASVTTALALLLTWAARRTRVQAVRLLNSLVFVSVGVPSIIIALALLTFYVRTPIYGTVWVIVVGQTASSLAFACRAVSATLVQLSPELEEAAELSGAGQAQTLRRVMLPLLAPALASTWLWVLLHSVRDFTFPLLLATTGNVMLSALIFQLWSGGLFSEAAALAILLAAGVLALTAISRHVLIREMRSAPGSSSRRAG